MHAASASGTSTAAVSGGWPAASFSLHTAGVPAGPIRKPAAMAIFKSEPVGDFTLDVDLRSTAPVDLDVRDVLLIFGYQSPTRFYYVHLSKKTDAVHNGIFLVNDADRKRLDPPTSVGRLVDQEWHHVRLVRAVRQRSDSGVLWLGSGAGSLGGRRHAARRVVSAWDRSMRRPSSRDWPEP